MENTKQKKLQIEFNVQKKILLALYLIVKDLKGKKEKRFKGKDKKTLEKLERDLENL